MTELPADEWEAVKAIREVKRHGYGSVIITVDTSHACFVDEVRKRHKPEKKS